MLIAKAYDIVLCELLQDGNLDLDNFLELLDNLYFPCIDLWRRPDMLILIRPIKDSIATLLKQGHHLPQDLQEGLYEFVVYV